MKLKEFMEILKEAAAYTKKEEQAENNTMSTACSPSYGGGIQCQIYLTADGDVSTGQTGVSIAFIVPAAK